MKRVIFKCETCSLITTDVPSNYKRRKHHFCSRGCQVEWQKISRIGKNNPYYTDNEHKNKHHKKVTIKGVVYLEHRYVMEKHLGRKLKPGEEVHHLDFNPHNNTVENLVLCKNRAEHRKYHRR